MQAYELWQRYYLNVLGFFNNTVPEKLLWIFYFLTNFVEIAVFY